MHAQPCRALPVAGMRGHPGRPRLASPTHGDSESGTGRKAGRGRPASSRAPRASGVADSGSKLPVPQWPQTTAAGPGAGPRPPGVVASATRDRARSRDCLVSGLGLASGWLALAFLGLAWLNLALVATEETALARLFSSIAAVTVAYNLLGLTVMGHHCDRRERSPARFPIAGPGAHAQGRC